MKRFYYMWTGLFLLVLTACHQGSQTKRECRSVKVDTVFSAGEQTTLQYPGKVKATQDVSLSFRVSGTIQRFLVTEGSRVKQGQLLAELDPTDYEIQLEATEAEYQQIKSEAERVMALYQDQGTTPVANDKAVYGLKQITAKRKHHQDQLAYTRLYAPFDGTIQKRLFMSHETVGAGMPVISMVSNGAPEVEISLPAAEYIRRDSFEAYHCTFDVYPGQVYPLKFISVTPKANSNQLYTMRLQLLPTQQSLPSPGMNTMVTILCKAQQTDQLSVSSNAVFHVNNRTYVYVFHPKNQQISLCEVQMLELLSNGRTLVTSAQLKPGDVIVASGVHHLKEGESVTPLTPPAATNVGGLL